MPDYNQYNKKFKPLARALRNKSTKAEIRLWCEVLKNKNMMGFTFLRQRIVERYIADFLCKELMLVIELDGKSHDSEEAIAKDDDKDRTLAGLGFTVIRIRDEDVMDNIEHVATTIAAWIEAHQPAKGSHPPDCHFLRKQQSSPFKVGPQQPPHGKGAPAVCIQSHFEGMCVKLRGQKEDIND